MKEEYQRLRDSGDLGKHYAENDQAVRYLKITSITVHRLEPSPIALTCLQ